VIKGLISSLFISVLFVMLEHNSYPCDVGDVPEPLASPLNEPLKGLRDDDETGFEPQGFSGVG
jgi:hypothetical protein